MSKRQLLGLQLEDVQYANPKYYRTQDSTQGGYAFCESEDKQYYYANYFYGSTVYLVKYDLKGNIIWERSFGNASSISGVLEYMGYVFVLGYNNVIGLSKLNKDTGATITSHTSFSSVYNLSTYGSALLVGDNGYVYYYSVSDSNIKVFDPIVFSATPVGDIEAYNMTSLYSITYDYDRKMFFIAGQTSSTPWYGIIVVKLWGPTYKTGDYQHDYSATNQSVYGIASNKGVPYFFRSYGSSLYSVLPYQAYYNPSNYQIDTVVSSNRYANCTCADSYGNILIGTSSEFIYLYETRASKFTTVYSQQNAQFYYGFFEPLSGRFIFVANLGVVYVFKPIYGEYNEAIMSS